MHILLSGIGRLRIWVSLIMLCLACASCNDDVLVVLNLDTSAVPPAVTTFVMRATLNGTIGNELRVPASQRRIAMHLPPGSTGSVGFEIIGIESGGCRYDFGGVIAQVPGGPSNASEETVRLSPSSGRMCWQKISTPTSKNLYAMTGRGQTAYVVGDGGVLLRCSGTTCTQLKTGTSGDLRGVWVNAAGDVYAVGRSATLLRCPGGSGPCLQIPAGPSRDLQSVWGTAEGDVVAVGDYGTFVLCIAGMPSCNVGSSGAVSDFRKVLGSDRSNAYIVGTNGYAMRCELSSFFGSCTQLTTGVTEELRSVATIVTGGVSSALIVGDDGRLLRCTQNQGGCLSLSGAYTGTLFDAAATSPTLIHAVGETGTVLRCTGQAGPSACEALTTRSTSTLRAVWGLPDTDVYAVGTGGALLGCPGSSTTCAAQASGTQATLTAIWGSDAKNLYVAGEGGTLLRRY